MLSIICAMRNAEFHSTSENFYLKSFWCRTQFRANVTNCYMDFILDLYVFTLTGSTIINQKPDDNMFAPGAVSIE